MQHRSPFSARFSTESSPIPVHFGAHLRLLRDRHALSQAEVVCHLDAWQQAAYSKVEKGTRAPLFEQLEPIYRALREAGVRLTVQDREYFYLLARDLLESRQRRHARQSEEAWKALYDKLAAIDGLPLRKEMAVSPPLQLGRQTGQRPRWETGHLLGRERWLSEVIEMITRPSLVKVLVLQGPPGGGKTSELHRLAYHFMHHLPRYEVVMSEPAPIQLGRLDATAILEQLLAEVGEVVNAPSPLAPTSSLSAHIASVLGSLSRWKHPTIICLDNAEHVFDEEGTLEPIWQRFLIQFAQANHQAVFVLASQEWPTGTFLAESQRVVTVEVPRLSQREGEQLLQMLGLRTVSEALLDLAVERTGGMPVCLEWVVRLVREPFLRDEWAEFDEQDEGAILSRLLDDSALFGGAVASRVQPLLDRVLKRLSNEAATALQDLALAPVPLGAPALKVLYQTPNVLRELREASLLVAYPQRAQLLPMVAAQVRQRLTASQVAVAEERLMQALMHWLMGGKMFGDREMGALVTSIAEISLKQHRLLDAAQFILRYGWLSFKLGHARRIAQLALKSIEKARSHATSPLDLTQRCGGILLFHFLAPFAEQTLDAEQRRREYHLVRQAAMEGSITLQPITEVYLTRILVAYTYSTVDEEQAEGAHALFSSCRERIASSLSSDSDVQAALLEIEAYLLTRQSDLAEEQGAKQQASAYREQAIGLYQRAVRLLSNTEGLPTLTASLWKKRLAKVTTSLGYHLDQIGRYEDALPVIEQSILLKEEGYVEPGTLASSYGEKSQALAALGRYEEALHFDALAVEEVERMARAGDTLAQAERWVYQVNRACLYLSLQRIDDAERLLREAQSHIAPTRRQYSVLADQTLKEIEAWRMNASSSYYQRDWRWIGRLRDATSYNAFWWLAHAGPFSSEEQQAWQALSAQPAEEATQKQRETMLRESRQRELEQALAERREPQLFYPAIPIEEVRSRIVLLTQLEADLSHSEPNEIIRTLYREKIEEEIALLSLIEAAHTRDRERFWTMNQVLHPAPTQDEMRYTLSRVYALIEHGLQQEHSREIAQRLVIHLQTQLHLTFDPRQNETTSGAVTSLAPSSTSRRYISARAAQRFFTAVLQEGGYRGWSVVLDATAAGARVEAAAQLLLLPERKLSLEECKTLYDHEVLGHIADSVAGERSLLGLLAVGTKNYLPVLEGVALYREMQLAQASGKAFDDSRIWLGTLSTGLAAGIGVPAQTFTQLFSFLKAFLILFRVLRRPDEDRATGEKSADNLAQTFCLRTFRGVPDLEKPGVCYSKDACYLRGLLAVQREMAHDSSIIDRLSIGRTAIEYVPVLERLGIKPVLQPLRELVRGADLDAYLLSFEDVQEAKGNDAKEQR